MVKNALEPEWEARFEGMQLRIPTGAGCHDAIAKIYLLARPHRRKKWVVDADIKGAFDNICHDFLLQAIGDVPGRELISPVAQGWGHGRWGLSRHPSGTPQGGVISPLLLNVALHGMEAALACKHNHKGKIAGKRAVVRYADDFVVFCESQEDALRVKDRLLPAWLAERGLTLSEEKTRIVHLTEGFDFLGFNVRHYSTPRTTRTGYKLLITTEQESGSRQAEGTPRDVAGARGPQHQGSSLGSSTRSFGVGPTTTARRWHPRHSEDGQLDVPPSDALRERTHPKKSWKWDANGIGAS